MFRYQEIEKRFWLNLTKGRRNKKEKSSFQRYASRAKKCRIESKYLEVMLSIGTVSKASLVIVRAVFLQSMYLGEEYGTSFIEWAGRKFWLDVMCLYTSHAETRTTRAIINFTENTKLVFETAPIHNINFERLILCLFLF